MRRVFVDTNVFVYAIGADHPYREPCRRVVELIAAGSLLGETSVEVVQEFAHVRGRRSGDWAEAAARAREIIGSCRPVHPFGEAELMRALDLLARHVELTVRDAVHVATALGQNIDAILSADRHFDAIAGVERIDPADDTGVRRLTR